MHHSFNRKQILIVGFLLILFSFVIFQFNTLTKGIQNVTMVLSPLLTGAVLAYALLIPMDFFERKVLRFMDKTPFLQKAKKALSLLIVFVLISAVILFLLTEILPQIGQLVNIVITRLPALLQSLNSLLKEQGIIVSDILLKQLLPDAGNPAKVQSLIESGGQILMNGIIGSGNVVGSVFSSVLGTFFTIMFMIYVILGKDKLCLQSRKLLYATQPEARADRIKALFQRANKVFRTFIANQVLEAVILGVLLFLSMLLFKMPYALLISALTAVFAIIPIIGGWIASICGFLLIATSNIELALYFILLFLVVQTIEGNVIYPRVMGSAIGLPGLWVLVAVVIGQSFFGLFGALFMIPVTSLAYSLLREYSEEKIQQKQIAPEKVEV